MLQFMIMIFILIINIFFCMSIHPLSIGLLLLIQTILTSLLMGMMYQSFWFSYILFLVFVGAMLVMFIYMTSLASNEMFSMLNMKSLMFMIIIFLFMMFMLLMDKTIFSLLINYEMFSFNNKYLLLNENIMNLNKIYNYPTNLMSMLLIYYLFFTLIIIVKITNFFMGPLRML